jgi:TPP-dependent trihydroxycyclohexane-1,2-dione (THcHDO) dehydratase
VRFVGINVAPMDASKLAALPVVADVKRTLPELAKALKDAGYKGTQSLRYEDIQQVRSSGHSRN